MSIRRIYEYDTAYSIDWPVFRYCLQVSQYSVFQIMDTAYWSPDLAAKKSTKDKKNRCNILDYILELLKTEERRHSLILQRLESIKIGNHKTQQNSQFLGLAVTTDDFIEGILQDCQAYDEADSKSVKFNWGEKEETAFQTLKQKL
ncbi:hypothetical protein Tco_1569183 [Tanacetum coccineum]